jgi:Na+/proline symporter
MNNMRPWIAVGVVILFVVCLVDLPFARKRNRSLHGYFLLNGELRLPGFVATILSANLSIGNFVIFVASWGYLFGWGGIFWFTVNLLLNIIGYLLFLPVFRGYIEASTNSGTLHEFLAIAFATDLEPYQRRIRFLASATTITGLLFAIVFELHLGTVLLAPLLGVNPVILFSLFAILICLYSAIGGFHTLVFTDFLQSAAIIVGSAIIIPTLLGAIHDSSAAANVYPLNLQALNIGVPNILGICLIGTGWFLVAMDQWQRSCATRSAERTRKGMILYFLIISAFGVLFGLVGMFARLMIEGRLPAANAGQFSKGANPLNDFFLYAAIDPTVSPVIFALFAVALIACATSTANTFLIVSGHSFVTDVLIAVAKKTSIHQLSAEQEKGYLSVARASITGMAAFVIVIWVILATAGLLSDPLNFFFIAYSIQFALLAPMLFTRLPVRLYPSPRGVFVSVLVGVIGAIGVGFGLWCLTQRGDPSLLFGLKASEWLPLTPLITTVLGIIPLALSRRAQ